MSEGTGHVEDVHRSKTMTRTKIENLVQNKGENISFMAVTVVGRGQVHAVNILDV